jgi:hypothetical protein
MDLEAEPLVLRASHSPMRNDRRSELERIFGARVNVVDLGVPTPPELERAAVSCGAVLLDSAVGPTWPALAQAARHLTVVFVGLGRLRADNSVQPLDDNALHP